MSFAEPINRPRRNGELASYGADASLIVEFYKHKVFMEHLSEQQGKPVYEWMDYVHIILPGGKTDVRRKVRMEMPPGANELSDPDRFPRQWQAYQNKQEQVQGGLPLEDFTPMPRPLVEDFKSCKIHTVEALAGIHDGAANNMPLDWRKWRDKAQAWLKSASDNAPVLALQAENDQLKADMEALKAQMVAFMAEAPKRGPGRPPKAPAEGTQDHAD